MNEPLDRIRQRSIALIAGATIAGLALYAGIGAGAQNTTSSAAQTQSDIFSNLPPDQQKAILEQMRRGGVSKGKRDKLEFPTVEKPRKEATDEESEDNGDRFRIPKLKKGDTVVLDVSVRFPDDTPNQQMLDKELVDKQERDKLDPAKNAQIDPKSVRLEALRAEREDRRKREALTKHKRTEEEQEFLERLRLRIVDANPYKLSDTGTLEIPGVVGIPLLGLNEEQATTRLLAEPALRDLRIRLTLLPLERQDVDALKPFGYDLFKTVPSTFALVSDTPVPAEYIVGPGDTITLQLVGTNDKDLSLPIGRDGRIQIPAIGSVTIGGMHFGDARRLIEQRVSAQLIGTRAEVGLGELRAITVFVAGEAEQPGAYTVSALSTITNAIFATGGVKPIGSLRNLELKRAGSTVTHLDLYDLLLHGNAGADRRLLPGDVVFIPPVGATVGVAGEIVRPAIYELKGDTTVAEFLILAGGLTPKADPHAATLERTDGAARVVVNLDVSSREGGGTPLRSGDLLRVRPISPNVRNVVLLQGHVYRPASFAWHDGMRLLDVLPSVAELKPHSDLHYVLIRRETRVDRHVSVVSADLEAAWRDPSSPANLAVQPGDEINVFDEAGGRERIVDPILRELRREAGAGKATPSVSVSGRVRVPGEYPFEPGMRVSGLIRAGGTLDEAAYGIEAELMRTESEAGEYRRAAPLRIDLERVLAGNREADLTLQPLDFLVIKPIPQWTKQAETVTVSGEVRFPGKYPVRRGETLYSLLQRSGGLTDLAFAEGAVFTRESLKEREATQVKLLSGRLQRDLAGLALQATQATGPGVAPTLNASEPILIGQSLLDQLREAEPVGRLVIDVDRIVHGQNGAPYDVVLKDGDKLIVPRRSQEVTVLGEVQSNTSHLFDPSLGLEDYVALSGGTTRKADKGRTYVVRANGNVVAGSSGSSFFHHGGVAMRPGDTIVVPLNAEQMRALPLWTAITTIIYNLAIAAAAVHAL
jgi:protein involved in polysaccharide export with SLBB domain